MVIVGESSVHPVSADSRTSTKSRTSKSSRISSRRSRSWYKRCCCCGGGGSAAVWSVGSPAKFYCCRADLVADMARERSERTKKVENNANNTVMDEERLLGCDEDGDYEFAEEALPDETFREVFNRSHQDDTDECWDVREPDLPYVENLPHQLSSGRVIIIEGAVLPSAEGFAVNLACGAGKEPDLALHLNPRLDRGYVARNSRVKGVWGEEEQATLGGSPFRAGRPFLLHILVTATGFKVSVDRMHLCNFQFRMPLSKVCRLEIHGDIALERVSHTRLEVYPDRSLDDALDHLFPTIPTDHAVPWSIDLPNVENLFIGRLKPNLRPGLEISIEGRVKLLPQSFYVNLQQGCQLWPHPNVHFHLNPRFAAEDYEHVVVTNSWLHMSWGSEQRYGRCRFRPGLPFSMVIYVEEERYRVTVDGLQQATMFHRAPPSHVDTLVIRGDLMVTRVGVAMSAPVVERLPSPGTPMEGSPTGSFVNLAMPRAFRTDSLIALSPDSRSFRSDSDVDMDRTLSLNSHDLSETSAVVQNAVPCEGKPLEGKPDEDQAASSDAAVEEPVASASPSKSSEEEAEPEAGPSNVRPTDDSSLLPKAAMSFIIMGLLYGGYILRR